MTTAYVVGLGNAGMRFLRACHATGVRVIGACDALPERREALSAAGILIDPVFAASLEENPCDLLIVATPEWERTTVLTAAAQIAKRPMRVLCEKPIAAEAASAALLRRHYSSDDIAVHFVERHSPVVDTFRAHLERQALRLARGSFRWGKYRVSDARPTLGVLADACHPIDLILFLAGTPSQTPFRVKASGVSSDYAGAAPARLDTIHLSLAFDTGLTIDGMSSYVWSGRQRYIEAILADSSGSAAQIAVLEFDCPEWDSDSLKIYDISRGDGVPWLIDQANAGHAIRPEVRTVSKTCRFIEDNVRELSGNRSLTIARLDDAIYVQTILDALAVHCEAATSTAGFARPGPVARSSTQRAEFLCRYLSGAPVAPHEFIWDEGF